MKTAGKGFKIFIGFLLVGIFFELLTIIGLLGDEINPHGDIAIVDVLGPIEGSRETVRTLKKFSKQEDVKAIVLRVDSPGGVVGASQEIHDAVKEANQKKPLVVSMGNVAASGGYYVSAPARKIVATPGTITGSLGVIAQYFMVGELLKKAHLQWEVIKAGKVKDIGSPFRKMTDEERKILSHMTEDIHEQFIEAVATGRKMKVDDVRNLADGRVVSGRQAQKLGLVDELGGLERAIEIAAKLGNVQGEPKVIYPEKERFQWLENIAEGKLDTSLFRVEYRLVP